MAVLKKTPAIDFLDKLGGLIKSGSYKEASQAYKDFEKANPTADFMILEAVPFRVQNQIIKTVGSPTAFSIYSLRHPTWTTEIVEAFEDPAKFDAYVKKLEADVRASQPKK
ncbi:hypothetical protein [Terrihabitans soli]|nr:hypothetical protein [Terrihabitans soli]